MFCLFFCSPLYLPLVNTIHLIFFTYVLINNTNRLVDMICEKMSDSLQDQNLAKNSNGDSIQDLNAKSTQRSSYCSC